MSHIAYTRFLTYMYYFDKSPKSRKILELVDPKREAKPPIRAKVKPYRSWINEFRNDEDYDDSDDD